MSTFRLPIVKRINEIKRVKKVKGVKRVKRIKGVKGVKKFLGVSLLSSQEYYLIIDIEGYYKRINVIKRI